MMINFHQSVETNHNINWPYNPDCFYKILIIRGFG